MTVEIETSRSFQHFKTLETIPYKNEVEEVEV